MASRRQETDLPEDRPVKFYKIVALTFLFITIALVGSIVFMSSKRATITITSKTSPIEVQETAVISANSDQTKSSSAISGSVTTTELTLDETFQPQGQKEVPATSTGMITIINESSRPQPLVETTRFLSEDGVLFRLSNQVSVPANGEIEAEVYADQKGEQGNIGPTEFTIPGLSSARQEQVYGESSDPMTGGVKTKGIVSQKDITRAKKSLKNKFKQQAKDSLSDLKNDQKKIVINMKDYTTTSSIRKGQEAESFQIKAESKVVAAIYNKADLKKLAMQSLNNKTVEGSDVVESSKSEPNVSFTSYNSEDNSVKLSVSYKGTVTLDPESEKIEKEMFYGKSEQEVRRYLLSLNNVHSAKVDFSPGWIGSVPHVADHVNIVVKKIQ